MRDESPLYVRLFGAIDGQLDDQQRDALRALVDTARTCIRDAAASGLSTTLTRTLARPAIARALIRIQRTFNIPIQTDRATVLRILDAIGEEVARSREKSGATR